MILDDENGGEGEGAGGEAQGAESQVENQPGEGESQVEEESEGSEETGEGEGEAAASAEGQGESVGQGKSSKPHWAEGRLARKTAENKELKAKLAELQGQKPQARNESDEEFNRRVNERAAELAAQRGWNDRVNAATLEGHKAYGQKPFEKACATIQQLVDLDDAAERQSYVQFVSSAMETGEAPKLFMLLAEDPQEAARIMELGPAAQGVALAKLASKESQRVSDAPAPIKPVGSRGDSRAKIAADDPKASDKLSIAEFMKRRSADIESGRSRARR